MTNSSPTAVAAPSMTERRAHSLLSLYLELSKARLSAMVVVTTALGYIVAARSHPNLQGFDFLKLIWTCIGTFLAAAGASAFNQAIEAPRDAKMNRTKNRPIPAGRLSRTHAAFFALLVSIAGVAILCPTSNGLTAILATTNVLIYVLLYTPMKPLTSTNTLVGAVVGAIPPIMGWTAVTNSIDAGAWILGGILFAWQIPHFLALAWMYRADYARGGYKMISVTEPSGRKLTHMALIYSLLLIPLSMAMMGLGLAGLPFVILSVLLAVGLIVLAIRFVKTRAQQDARRLFLATLLYLPLLTLTLCLDTRSPLDRFTKEHAGYVTEPVDQVIYPAAAR